MKYCSKCGKELLEEAVICPLCGCAATSNDSTEPYVCTHPIVKSSSKSIFLMSIMAGGIFGFFIGLMYSVMYEANFVLVFLCGGSFFALLFFGGMTVSMRSLEKSTFTKMRALVAKKTEIYFEGGANRNGNGGRLFITANGIEYYTHKHNFSSESLLIPYKSIVLIQKVNGGKLVIRSEEATYTFVVDSADEWLMFFAKHDQTKGKLKK